MADIQANKGTTLALQVDSDGTVRYDAIAQHGRAVGSKVQSSFKGESLPALYIRQHGLSPGQTWCRSPIEPM